MYIHIYFHLISCTPCMKKDIINQSLKESKIKKRKEIKLLPRADNTWCTVS